MILPVFAVWTIQIQARRKLTVLALFWTRVNVCIFIGTFQLGSMELYLSGNDPT